MKQHYETIHIALCYWSRSEGASKSLCLPFGIFLGLFTSWPTVFSSLTSQFSYEYRNEIFFRQASADSLSSHVHRGDLSPLAFRMVRHPVQRDILCCCAQPLRDVLSGVVEDTASFFLCIAPGGCTIVFSIFFWIHRVSVSERDSFRSSYPPRTDFVHSVTHFLFVVASYPKSVFLCVDSAWFVGLFIFRHDAFINVFSITFPLCLLLSEVRQITKAPSPFFLLEFLFSRLTASLSRLRGLSPCPPAFVFGGAA